MGAAEVVPGVSGGTIAFISGLYERLVNGIQRLTPMCLLELPRQGIRQWWLSLDLNFLTLLFGSMMISVLILARGVSWLLDNQPIFIWSFFFGLLLASVAIVSRRLMPMSWDKAGTLLMGIVMGVLVTRVVPVEAEVSALSLFLGGCVAVCAWILPGLSGSFILLVLGLYQTVITAVKDLELITLGWVAAGCVVGLLSFSRILSLLLKHFHDTTVALLCGFMVGSLMKIWPWKHTTSYQIKSDGSQIPVIQEPVFPVAFEQLTGRDAEIHIALIACLLGIGLVLLMNRFALLGENGNQRGETSAEKNDVQGT